MHTRSRAPGWGRATVWRRRRPEGKVDTRSGLGGKGVWLHWQMPGLGGGGSSPHSIFSKSGGRYFVSEKSLSFYLKTGQMMFCKIFIFGILKMSFSAHIHFDFWPRYTLKDISRDKLLHHHHPTDLYDQGKGGLFTQCEVFTSPPD